MTEYNTLKTLPYTYIFLRSIGTLRKDLIKTKSLGTVYTVIDNKRMFYSLFQYDTLESPLYIGFKI